MKILVTGGTGLIGWRLINLAVKKNYEVYYTFLNNKIELDGTTPIKLEIGNRKEVIEKIRKINPDVTVHTAAMTVVDQCETDNKLARKINVEGTKNVVDACKQNNGKIVYLSSSFVFDGGKKLYYEDDEPKPINFYGFTKLEGEKIVSSSGLDFLITRTDQPYCWTEKWQKKTNVVRVLEKLNSGEIDKEIIDWYNNPTFANNLVEVIINLIEANKNGIYHTVGPDFISRYEWSLKIAEIFGKDKNLIKPVNSSEFNILAKRPNANLNNEKAEKDSGIELVGLSKGLKIMLKESEFI